MISPISIHLGIPFFGTLWCLDLLPLNALEDFLYKSHIQLFSLIGIKLSSSHI
uniref:Uncharacterized protein n=1 Tax=Arundo donax TaxID=35708 RepID=A0A0A9BVT0_ARUDO